MKKKNINFNSNVQKIIPGSGKHAYFKCAVLGQFCVNQLVDICMGKKMPEVSFTNEVANTS